MMTLEWQVTHIYVLITNHDTSTTDYYIVTHEGVIKKIKNITL